MTRRKGEYKGWGGSRNNAGRPRQTQTAKEDDANSDATVPNQVDVEDTVTSLPESEVESMEITAPKQANTTTADSLLAKSVNEPPEVIDSLPSLSNVVQHGVEFQDFGFEDDSDIEPDIMHQGVESDSGSDVSSDADDNVQFVKKNRNCGKLQPETCIYTYIKGIQKDMGIIGSRLYMRVKNSGVFWVEPPDPVKAVYDAKEVSPDPFYYPRVYVFVPLVPYPNLQLSCTQCNGKVCLKHIYRIKTNCS